MKATATQIKLSEVEIRVLRSLLGGPLQPEYVAKRVWPGRHFKSPAKGGPWGGSVAASFLMGRFGHRTKLVRRAFKEGTYASYWELTSEGQKIAAQWTELAEDAA